LEQRGDVAGPARCVPAVPRIPAVPDGVRERLPVRSIDAPRREHRWRLRLQRGDGHLRRSRARPLVELKVYRAGGGKDGPQAETETASSLPLAGPVRSARGSVKEKVDPSPGALATHSRPLMACTSCLARYRPRPVPPVRRVSALSTR